MTVTVVALALGLMSSFPLCKRLNVAVWSIGILVCIISSAHGALEVHITGQCTEMVHHAIDTEIVAVIFSSITCCGNLFVQ